MCDVDRWQREQPVEQSFPTVEQVGHVASELVEKALNDAKAPLHPLLRSAEVEFLNRRIEFLQAFKGALEQRIARRLVAWQPHVQAVFRFDEIEAETIENWDGSIHLLVKVSHLSKAIKELSKALDKGLIKRFRRSDWSRFRKRQSILEVQQVTPNEIRRGMSYGAMFYAVYAAPVKVWPREGLKKSPRAE